MGKARFVPHMPAAYDHTAHQIRESAGLQNPAQTPKINLSYFLNFVTKTGGPRGALLILVFRESGCVSTHIYLYSKTGMHACTQVPVLFVPFFAI